MTAPSVQLEVAAQWLFEGALALRGKEPADDLYRVAEDCLRVAGKPMTSEQWLRSRKTS
jgi:hypothetical protein